MEKPLEKELLIRCKKGDGTAFDCLIRNYRRQLYAYLSRFVKESEAADDLFQETLLKVWFGLRNYNESNKFSSWLFTIAHNVAVDNTRKLKRIRTVVENKSELEFTTSITPHDFVVAEETEKKLVEVVECLPEKQKEVFLLRQHGDMTFKEIAQLLNEPLSTVLSHMNYAVKKIRKEFRKENAIQ